MTFNNELMSEEKNKIPKVGEKYEIPVEGSLGLFALGYKGVIAWREVRDEALRKAGKEKKKENNDNIK